MTEQSILLQRRPSPPKDVGKQTTFSFTGFPHPQPQDRRQKQANILALEAAIDQHLPLFVAIGRSYRNSAGALTSLVLDNQAISIESLRHAGLNTGASSRLRQSLSPKEQILRFTE